MNAEALARIILLKRGIADVEAQNRFLSSQLSDLPNPVGSLRDVEIACEILGRARDRQKKVVVFGDYDVDGTTASSLLFRVLKAWGFDVSVKIPHRILEGYGLTEEAVKNLFEEFPTTAVVVTVDCGISNFRGVELLKQKGVEVIITDHHTPPSERVGADAVLNPKQTNCSFPDKNLAGVGVALFLLLGLRRALSLDFALSPYLDLVAVGTIADLAPLVGANRIIAKIGLDRMKRTQNLGLRYLIDRLSLSSRITARDIGFLVGPRLNASGRIGNPRLGFEFLTEEATSRILDLGHQLEEMNSQRRALQLAQVEEARVCAEQVMANRPSSKTLVVKKADFHLGVVGLIASRLAQDLKRAVVVLTRVEDEHMLADLPPELAQAGSFWKGSLRAPAPIHLAKTLEAVSVQNPNLLKSFGGHAQAAGVSLFEGDLDRFENAFEAALVEGEGGGVQQIDLDFRALTLNSLESLVELHDLLEPFGIGNEPLLCEFSKVELESAKVLKKKHLKLSLKNQGSERFDVLQFDSPWVRLASSLVSGSEKAQLKFRAELTVNEWRGQRKPEFYLRDLIEVSRGQKILVTDKMGPENEGPEGQGEGRWVERESRNENEVLSREGL